MKSSFKKMLAIVAIATSSTAAFALQEVKIQHAVNSPSITVKYTKMAAAMAEIRLNGRSYSTQKLDASASQGELNFLIDFAVLSEGDNQLEVILFDASGKELGRQESTLKAAKDKDAAVTISNFKGGETIKGLVEIRLGVNRDFREMYVSFFINDQWKALKNYPPYSYLWDTTGFTNGWHEVEAWVVDENNNTFKTRKVRVFVNNPGGRTNRVAPATPKVVPAPVKSDNPTSVTTAPVPTKTPKTMAVTIPVARALNNVQAIVGKPTGVKASAPIPAGISTDQKLMTPTGRRVVAPKVSPTPKTPAVKTVAPKVLPQPVAVKTSTPKVQTATTAAPAAITVGYGTRIPKIGTYQIMYAGKPVQFDVQPRVEEGVPLTPFRHLFEYAGGKVAWEHQAKRVHATGLGQDVFITIGQDRAKVNGKWVGMERAAFIERSRTIVPLSFVSASLNVNVAFDPKTGHVFITSGKK
jgi:hypothetical protein